MSDNTPLTDAELAQLEADLTDKTTLIRDVAASAVTAGDFELLKELADEGHDLARRILNERELRRGLPGAVHDFRPRPSNGPGDQGSL